MTRKEAQLFASDLQIRKENFGTRLLQMPESLRQKALDCVEHLKGYKATLTEAVSFYVRHRLTTERSCRGLTSSKSFYPPRSWPDAPNAIYVTCG